MNEIEKEILSIADRTPKGKYVSGAYDLYLDKDDEGIRVTIVSIFDGNHMILFDEVGAVPFVGHLSWHRVRESGKINKTESAILMAIKRLDKSRNFKPLIQRVKEWWGSGRV